MNCVQVKRLNKSKSGYIVGKHLSVRRAAIIANATGFYRAALLSKYLGIPLYKGPKKAFLFDDLICRIRDRISGWEKKILSPGGRITLLRSLSPSPPQPRRPILPILPPNGFVLQTDHFSKIKDPHFGAIFRLLE